MTTQKTTVKLTELCALVITLLHTTLLVCLLATDEVRASAIVNTNIIKNSNVTTPYYQCFNGKVTNRWMRLWSTLNVKATNIHLTEETITVFFGANKIDVEEQVAKSASLLHVPVILLPWMQTNRKVMSPLVDNCIAVSTPSHEKVHLVVSEHFVNELYLLLTLLGIVIFLAAPRLSKSVVFHYSSGITLGVLASLLVLVYILSRFIPRKTGAISLLIGGWALCLYFLRWAVENFFSMQYKTYIIGYFVIAALVSFTVCYWYGPVTNNRTLYLIQLFMQLVALVLVYNGSHHEGSTVAIVVILVSVRWIPLRWVTWLTLYFRRERPLPKIRLLTEDEYYEQGLSETQKAMDSLREYCRSPECNQWKMVSTMESPKRFAQFVIGEEHVTRDEVAAYEDDLSILTFDSDTESEAISSDIDMDTE